MIYPSIYVVVNTQCRCKVGEVSPLLSLDLLEERRGAREVWYIIQYIVK